MKVRFPYILNSTILCLLILATLTAVRWTLRICIFLWLNVINIFKTIGYLSLRNVYFTGPFIDWHFWLGGCLIFFSVLYIFNVDLTAWDVASKDFSVMWTVSLLCWLFPLLGRNILISCRFIYSAWPFFFFNDTRARKMAQWLRAWFWFPAPTWKFTTVSNSGSRGSSVLFWLLHALSF